MSYKITNTSYGLKLLGLLPGKSKVIEQINDDTKILYSRGLITIEEVVKKTSSNSKTTDTAPTVITGTKSEKECEVTDTNGRD